MKEVDISERIALGKLSEYFAKGNITIDNYMWIMQLYGIPQFQSIDDWKGNIANVQPFKTSEIFNMLLFIYQYYDEFFPKIIGEIIKKFYDNNIIDLLKQGEKSKEYLQMVENTFRRYLSLLGYEFQVNFHVTTLDLLDINILEREPDNRRRKDRLRLHTFLEKGFPSEYISLKGAYTRYLEGGTDYERQTLSSCRVALESFIKKITGKSEWRNGLGGILLDKNSHVQIGMSKDLEKLIRGLNKSPQNVVTYLTVIQLYSYLSAQQAHSQAIPSREEVELGLKLTEDLILFLVDTLKS